MESQPLASIGAGLLRAAALNLGFGAMPQHAPLLRNAAGGTRQTEAGLLRAAALNLGFGAVPQHTPLLRNAAGGTRQKDLNSNINFSERRKR